MVGTSKNIFRIFMYPWFAMGHLTPYLLTANKLAAWGHKIFLVIPPKVQSKLAPLNLHPDLIEFRPISIPAVEGLPAYVETTNDVSIEEQPLLRYAIDLTQPAIKSLLCDLKPHFIFYDLLHWLPNLAQGLQIKSVHYSVISPAAMSVLFAQDSETGFPSCRLPRKLCKRIARDLKYLDSVEVISSGLTLKGSLIAAICGSDALGFKTCKEIEGAYCEFLEDKLKKPILLAGPVVPKRKNLTLDEKWADWLDKFKHKTVIFCAFGSEAVLKKEQFEELLLGFELTGLPFLVALRPPFGVDSIEEALPDGFEERTKERGIVYGGWVPQQLILKHPSVGCFVTHCGYGSMWEGLLSNCQLVVLPHVADQYIHAELMSGDLKVAVEVEKGDEDGLFTKEGVHGVIMAVMDDGSEIGKEVRVNHDKYREQLTSKGFEDSYFDDFVQKLRTLVE